MPSVVVFGLECGECKHPMYTYGPGNPRWMRCVNSRCSQRGVPFAAPGEAKGETTNDQ